MSKSTNRRNKIPSFFKNGNFICFFTYLKQKNEASIHGREKKMKKNSVYEAPEATIVAVEALDLITTSTFSDPNVLDDGWIGA